MTEQTPRLKAPYIIATQAQKEVSYNMALNLLDALVQTAVESALLIAPPPAPSEGGLSRPWPDRRLIFHRIFPSK